MKNKNIQIGMLDRYPEMVSIIGDLDLIVTMAKHDDGFRKIRCFWPKVNDERKLELFMITYFVKNNFGFSKISLLEEECRDITPLIDNIDKYKDTDYGKVIFSEICPEMRFDEKEEIVMPAHRIFENYEDNSTYRKYFYIVEDDMTLNESIDHFLKGFKYKIDDDFDIITMQLKYHNQEIIYIEKLHEKARLNK